tara:strand:+ start:674 stop:1489 length:816 start_codon:yes stop_codon:yes gene_type:complete
LIHWLALFVAIAVSAIAAYYSIVGLVAIFAAAVIPVAIMGTSLEVAKLVTVSWLYQNWKITPKFLKYYLSGAVILLMLITSLGIFGFLSKAHIDQTLQSGDNTIQISQLDKQINRQQRIITDAENVISQLDSQVQTLIEYDRIRGPDGSLAVRKSQREERDDLNGSIDEAASAISALQTKRATLQKEQIKLEADVGPIRYVAELVYGSNVGTDQLETAVRWTIIFVIIVFDPLAVLLLLAANIGLTKPKRKSYYRRKGIVELDTKDILNVR